jgi:SHS2 domain-containing protein
MYEHFEHTADLGLRVRARSLEELFEDAARGLTAIIVERPPTGPGRPLEIRVEGTRLDYLMFDWLNELLFRFEREGRVCGDVAVRFDDEGLTGTLQVDELDRVRHVPVREVKAITYHRLRVEREGEDWIAELIVDI